MAGSIGIEHSSILMPINTITLQLRPLLKILQIIGGYPIVLNVNKTIPNLIHYKKDPNLVSKFGEKIFLEASISEKLFSNPGGIFKFKSVENSKISCKNRCLVYSSASFKWKTACFWYSLMLKSVIFLATVTFMTNIGLSTPQPINVFGYAVLFTQSSIDSLKYSNASIVLASILKLLEIIVLHFSTDQLVRWLNNWHLFQLEFINCFGKVNGCFKFDIQKYRNSILLFYLIIPTSIWLVLGPFFLFPIFEIHKPYLGPLLLTIAAYTMWGLPFLEDCKVCLILKSTALAYEQIRTGIQSGYVAENVNDLDIVNWRKLINTTRHQTALLSSYLKRQHIILVVEAVISCTLGASYVLKFIKDEGLNTQVMALVGTSCYCLHCIGRLYVKVGLAEEIAVEELLIANHLIKVEERCISTASKTELKFLHNMLTQNTVAINFGNYFSLNRKLLLQVGAQVVTYIIVFLQLEDSNRTGIDATNVTVHHLTLNLTD